MGLDLTLQVIVALWLTNADLFLWSQPTEFSKTIPQISFLSCNFNLLLCVWNGVCVFILQLIWLFFLNIITTFCRSIL